jgi:hypothetical protein
MSDHRISDVLLAAGFISRDGILLAPGARFELVPIGNFIELRIQMPNGTAFRAIMSASALKTVELAQARDRPQAPTQTL